MARFVGITGITDSPAFPERRRRLRESDGFGVWAAVPPSRSDTGRNTSGGWGHAIQDQPKSVLQNHRVSFSSNLCPTVSIDFPVMLVGWTLKVQALGVFRLPQGNVELSLDQLPFETKTALLFGSEVGKMFSSCSRLKDRIRVWH